MTSVSPKSRGWSLRLLSIGTIDVRVHLTFGLLLVWLGAQAVFEGVGLLAAGRDVLFVLLVFGSVVLHELGHALTAAHFGIRTTDITLYPIGGVARLERMPEDPREEFVIAVAGPLVNVVLAAGLFGLAAVFDGGFGPDAIDVAHGPVLPRLAVTNLVLALFNLIPAFPMDGGRILRAALVRHQGYDRATQIAARLGRTLAWGLGLLGVLGNPILLLIAVFVWLAGTHEAQAVHFRALVRDVPVTRAMITDFRVLHPDQTLGSATTTLLAGSQAEFPVVDDRGRLLGFLDRPVLIDALTRTGESGLVGDAMRADVAVLEPDERLDRVLDRLQADGGAAVVVRGDRVVGLMTAENLAEFVATREAMTAGSGGA